MKKKSLATKKLEALDVEKPILDSVDLLLNNLIQRIQEAKNDPAQLQAMTDDMRKGQEELANYRDEMMPLPPRYEKELLWQDDIPTEPGTYVMRRGLTFYLLWTADGQRFEFVDAPSSTINRHEIGPGALWLGPLDGS